MNKIEVRKRSVYGVPTVYPACDSAKRFALIANTITLTTETLKHIQKLGFEVVEILNDEHQIKITWNNL